MLTWDMILIQSIFHDNSFWNCNNPYNLHNLHNCIDMIIIWLYDYSQLFGIPLPKPCIIIRDYGKLGFGGITPIILRPRTNSLVSLYAIMCDYLRLFQHYWHYSNYSFYVFSQIQNNWNNRKKLKRFIIDFQAFWSIK